MNNKGIIILFTIIVFIIEAVLISLLFTLYYRRISSFRNRTNEIYKELDVDLLVLNHIAHIDNNQEPFTNEYEYILDERYIKYDLYKNKSLIYTFKISYNNMYSKYMVWIEGNGIKAYYEIAYYDARRVIIYKNYEKMSKK